MMKKIFFILALFFSVNSFAAISISPSTISGLTVGIPYNQALQGTGGTPDYLIYLSAGTLPAGTSIVYSGQQGGDAYLQGTPSTAATYTFTLTCRDSKLNTGTRSYTVTVIAAAAGTVTSVAVNAGTAISISGSPITSSGTITVTNTKPTQWNTATSPVSPVAITYTVGSVGVGTSTVSATLHAVGSSSVTPLFQLDSNLVTQFKVEAAGRIYAGATNDNLIMQKRAGYLFGPNIQRNVIIGSYANGGFYADSTTIGVYNTAVGVYALTENVRGSFNTAFGEEALGDNRVSNNTAIGYWAAGLNETGTGICAFGSNALHTNLSGQDNIAIGNNSLYDNVSGGSNIGIGTNALTNNLSDYNIAIGTSAMVDNSSGTKCISIGTFAGQHNTTAPNNINIGYQAGATATNGNDNTNVGHQAGMSNGGGGQNTCIGSGVFYNRTTGDYNTAIGANAGNTQTSGSRNLAIGANLVFPSTTGSDQFVLGGGSSSTAYLLLGDIANKRLAIGGTSIPTHGLEVNGDAQIINTNTAVPTFMAIGSNTVTVGYSGVVTSAGLTFSNTSINTTSGDAATINASAGRFRKDNTGTTFTLTDSYITANSIIILQWATDPGGGSAHDVYVVAGNGSAVITMGQAPGSDSDMNFLIIN